MVSNRCRRYGKHRRRLVPQTTLVPLPRAELVDLRPPSTTGTVVGGLVALSWVAALLLHFLG